MYTKQQIARAHKLALELLDENNHRHGLSFTSEYQAFRDAKNRCTNPRCSEFHRYGGRPDNPICFEYVSFKQFYNDLGPRPGEGYSLERVDNNGPYAPGGQCIWATAKQQAANRRKPVRRTRASR